MRSWDYREKPLIVFWETTKACKLVCRHCRAEAISEPLPDELDHEEALKLIDQVADFGRPYPILVFTGGDPLMRRDLWDLLEYSVSLGIRTAVAPSVTPLVTRDVIDRFKKIGVSRMSISLDSPHAEIHDFIRGYPGTWKRTVRVIEWARQAGLPVQVNTVVMRYTVRGLPGMLKLLDDLGVDVWEVFYVIPVGRAQRVLDLSPEEWEDVSAFLYEASKYGILIRTVEGPMFRRIALRLRLEEALHGSHSYKGGRLYRVLVEELRRLMGEPRGEPMAQTTGTRDGKGVIFVSYNGDVYPSGFLPYPIGNVRRETLKEIYTRRAGLMHYLREGLIKGRCGRCEFKEVCGGSRARAYSYTGDPLEEDPACPYQPGEFSRWASRRGMNMIDVRELASKLGRGKIL